MFPDSGLTPEEAQELAQSTLDGARWVGKQSVAAYDWSRQQAQNAYNWGAKEAQAAGNWAVDQGKNLTRGTVSAIGDPIYDAAGNVVNTWNSAAASAQRTADAISSAAERAKNFVLQRKPDAPVVPCPKPMSADEAADGCLIAAGCKTVCKKKGGKLSSADIAKARADPTKPDPGNECCAKKRAGWAAAGKPPRRIVYVNGISTTKAAHCDTLRAIAKQTCADVIGVYNATEGSFQDAVQTSRDRVLIKAANEGHSFPDNDGRNPAVESLSDLIVQDDAAGKPTEIWAHSQGGAITSLALFDARNRADALNIANPLPNTSVTSFGSAAPFWPRGLGSATHYVNINDATPFAFGLGPEPGEDSVRAAGAQVIRFSGPPTGPFVTQSMPRSWLPAATSNHGVDTSYLSMEKQRNRQLAAQGKADPDCG